MKRARELGQYFTPEPVVELCYRLLRALDLHTRNPRIVDPSCGDGAFLAYALDHGLTAPQHLYGIEKDPGVGKLDRRMNSFVRNGLLPADEYPDGSFDWVVGNPPFGTRCLRDQADLDALAGTVSERYTVWRGIGPERLASYPIEILFLERFRQLAKPGGYVAMIVPDGILANARLSYVREWLMRHAEIKAIISLPHNVFLRAGASSKSSVLVFRKAERPTSGLPIFMAELASHELTSAALDDLVRFFADSLNHPPFEGPIPQSAIRNPHSGARLDPAYYHSDYLRNRAFLEGLPNAVPLGSLIEYTTYGQVGARELSDSGVRLLTPANLTITEDGFVTGVNLSAQERFVEPGSRNDPPRSRLRRGDLLLANSGVACIGRAAVFASDEVCNISQHINLIRVKAIEPEYLAVYLQTRFGRLQIAREKCGVGACGINFERIRSILVPMLSAEVRAGIAEEYRRGDGIRGMVERLENLIGEIKE